jgi:IS30 family transposase
MWSFLLKAKYEAFKVFKRFKSMVEQQTGSKVHTFQTDRGSEFTSNKFSPYRKDEGISRPLTAPYTPQQNGVVEREVER